MEPVLRKLSGRGNQQEWWINPAQVKYVEADAPGKGERALTVYFATGNEGDGPDVRVVADTPENRLALRLER